MHQFPLPPACSPIFSCCPELHEVMQGCYTEKKKAVQAWNTINKLFFPELREMVEWCTRRDINLGHSVIFSFLGVVVKQGDIFPWKGMTSWNIPSGTTFLILLFIRQQDLFGLAGPKLVIVASLIEMRVRQWKRNYKLPQHYKIIWLIMHPQHPP